MYYNIFSPGVDAVDMTKTEEFQSLLKSASELRTPVNPDVKYTSRNVVVNGLRFNILEWGERGNPDIFLLHGVNQTAHSWDLVSMALAPKFHIIAVDQRGHGDSEWPRDGEMGADLMAKDAVAILKATGLERPAFLAHSMGGMVALSILVNEDLARQLVVVDIGPRIESEGRNEGSNAIQNFIRNNREFDSIDQYIESVHAYDPFRSREHITRTMIYNLMERADGKIVSKQFRRPVREGEMPPQPRSAVTLEDVKRIKCPVLIVRGGESPVLSPEAAERFQQALPDGKLVTVPKAGHNVHSQNTPGFLSEVMPFLGA
jgi:pimeloyl-ACP methyl ester carboxylesterase